MGKVTIPKGQVIHTSSDLVGKIEMVLSGSVKMTNSLCSITVTAGGLLGSLETPDSTYSYEYTALEDTVLFDYVYTKPSDIEKIVASNAKIISNLASASMRSFTEAFQCYRTLSQEADGLYRFIRETYDTYVGFCSKFKVPCQSLSYMDELTEFSPEEDISTWEVQFYNSLRTLSPEVKKALYSTSVYTGLGFTMQSLLGTKKVLTLISQVSDYLSELSAHIISGNAGDFFDLYSNLLFHVSKNPFADTTGIEATVSKMIIFMTDSKYVDIGILHGRVTDYRNALKNIEESLVPDEEAEAIEKDAYEALDKSLETILDYAGVDPEERLEFRDLVDSYKLLSDKNSTEDSARTLRRTIADRFYKIYEKAFYKSLNDKFIPYVIRMFFNFGYVDEELCGMSNATALYEISKTMKSDTSGIALTIYEWLVKIYNGEVMPSKNEFDMDYPTYLRDQKHNGYITAEQEKQMINDMKARLHFELSNLFTIGNRITFGRITTFCPLLSEHNILKPLKIMHATPEKIRDAFDAIRKVDFSCFYREVMFTAPKSGIQKEYIHVEVLPNVILMPNVGSRCSLWQETSGTKKDTPGRIMMSIFPTESIDDMLLRIAGEFRWELCKHIQGVHWNDVTDPSLTAEYCDYMQFYRKNHEISSDVKEKIKLQLQRAKNNYREAFVMDYVAWMKYESAGSPRLNKIARGILFRYCPFSVEIRTSIGTNPMYSDFLEKYNIKLGQKKHILDVLCQKITSQGLIIPPEITNEVAYFNR